MEVAITQPTGGPQLVEQLRQLSDQANSGDQQALLQLRDILADDRALASYFGDSTNYVETAWLSTMAADSPLAREAIKRRLADLKASLAGPQPSMIEQILADQVALNVMANSHAAYSEASATSTSSQQASFFCKRAESTQRRLLTALKMLALLRTYATAGLRPSESVGLPKHPRLSA
jgi:hypothetical protein